MSVFEKLSRVIEKLPFITSEQVAPVWAGYLLNRKLERLENKESISQYKSRVSRIEKHQYRMELELFLTEKQAKKGFSNMIETLKSFKGGD